MHTYLVCDPTSNCAKTSIMIMSLLKVTESSREIGNEPESGDQSRFLNVNGR